MSFVFVSSDYFPSIGGIQSWIKALVLEGGKAVVLSPDPSQCTETSALKRSDNSILRIFQLIGALFKCSEKHFVCWQTGSTGLAALIVSTLIPFKSYSVVVHGNEFLRPRDSLIKKMIFSIIMKRAKFVLCNSQYTKHLINIYYPGVRKTVVWCPAVVRSYQSDSSSSKTIITCASFLSRKGQGRVIESLEYLPDFKYLVVGSGEEEALFKLQEMAKGKSVEFILNKKDLTPYYGQSSVAVLASKNDLINHDVEGFGISAVESLYAKIPTVVFDNGGLSETGAIAISPYSTAEELAWAIKTAEITTPNKHCDPEQSMKDFESILCQIK